MVALLRNAQFAGRERPSARAWRQRSWPKHIQETYFRSYCRTPEHVLAHTGEVACYRTF